MLSPQLLELLRAWWLQCPSKGWLFTGLDPLLPLTVRQLNRACHAAAEAAELGSWVTPHTLRHYLPRPTMSGSFGRDSKRLRNKEISCRNTLATRHSQRDLQAVQEFQQIVIGPEAG
jgi:integrase